MLAPIKTLDELNTDELTGAQLLQIFETKKGYLIKTPQRLHFSNNPRRLITDNYSEFPAGLIEIYDLSRWGLKTLLNAL